MPRPNNAKYLAATAKTIKEAREKGTRATYRSSSSTSSRRSRPSGTTSRATIATIRPKTRRLMNDTAAWLRDNSVWVPLKVMLKSKPEELVEAGYPETEVRAFLAAYRELSDAESSSPGHVSEASAAKFLSRLACTG